jgi:hypothetical protein
MENLKLCVTCHEAKAVSAFNKRTAAPDGLQSRCRDCSRVWYVKNRVQHMANVKRHNEERRRVVKMELTRYLESHPCVDCRETDIRCLEFDHVDPAQKAYNVSSMLRSQRPWKEILKEIEKCDVRCANCHRRRTARMFGSWRHRAWLDGEPGPYEEIVL